MKFMKSVHLSDSVGSGFAGRALVGADEAPPCFETVSDFDSSSSRGSGAAPRRGARASSGLGMELVSYHILETVLTD